MWCVVKPATACPYMYHARCCSAIYLGIAWHPPVSRALAGRCAHTRYPVITMLACMFQIVIHHHTWVLSLW